MVGRPQPTDRLSLGECQRRAHQAVRKELVSLKPDVILAGSTPVTAALQRETVGIPIVFVVVSDPVGDGFVASLARPGGNITGFINFEHSMGGKWLVLLKEAAPMLKRVAIQSRNGSWRWSIFRPFVRGRRSNPWRQADCGTGTEPERDQQGH